MIRSRHLTTKQREQLYESEAAKARDAGKGDSHRKRVLRHLEQQEGSVPENRWIGMRFNVNNNVRVRLTDFGRLAHRINREKLFLGMTQRDGTPLAYVAPTEDADGWSTWQLWALMQEFGSHITMGFEPPFHTEIEIIKPIEGSGKFRDREKVGGENERA